MHHPQLEIFVQVADSGSFSKAAAARFCSPVSIMNQINDLEWRVGTRLFDRSNHGVTLTAAGSAFYEDALKIMADSRAAMRRARAIAGVEEGVIRIGTSFLRPCKPLLDFWFRSRGETPAAAQGDFQIRIVPFDDSPASLAAMLESLGGDLDCFVGPCDAAHWKRQHSICRLGEQRCCVALSRRHPLATRTELTWEDLEGETLMLVRRGVSPVLDRLRDEVIRDHPGITLLDMPNIYDAEVFNLCEQQGYLMETLEMWTDVHPSLVTLPMRWDYAVPYGIVYAKKPSKQVSMFVDTIRKIHSSSRSTTG